MENDYKQGNHLTAISSEIESNCIKEIRVNSQDEWKINIIGLLLLKVQVGENYDSFLVSGWKLELRIKEMSTWHLLAIIDYFGVGAQFT